MSAQYAQGYPYNGYPQQYSQPSQQYPPQYPPQYFHQYPQQYPAQPQPPYPYQGPPQQHQQPYPQQYQNQYQQNVHQQPPQSYPQAQQYGPPQPPAYQQPYAPHAQGQITQAPSTPNPRSCYNCGRPDHFAQDCPEPKRAIPAGDIHRSAYHAQKRLKIERPSSDPHVSESQPGYGQPAQGSPQGPYRYPDYAASAHPYQGPHPPATSVADASQANGPWQYPYQPSQYTPYQQYPPHSSSPSGGYPPYQGHPQQGFHNQTAPPKSGFDNRRHQVDRRSSDGPNIQQRSEPSSCGPSSYSGTSPTAHPSSQPHDESCNNHSPPAVSALHKSQSHSPSLEDGPIDLDEDEIRTLDVPDFPTIPGASQAVPVAFPLPSNFVVADALAPYQPPDAESGGLVKSKYIKSVDSLNGNIRDSDLWEEALAKDPALIDLTDPPRRLSTSNWSESRRSSDREFRPPFNRRKSSQVNHYRGRDSGRSPSFKGHHVKKDRDTWSRDRSRSPVRLDRRQSYSMRHGSFDRTDLNAFDASPMQTSPTDIHRNSINGKPESPYGQPRPPPPPPMHSSSWGDGQSDGPSDRGFHGDGIENGDVNGNAHGNGHQHAEMDGSVFSPSKARTERSHGRRRESSEESDTPRRRQVDDVTPRHKRRQPKVAAAYSRRW